MSAGLKKDCRPEVREFSDEMGAFYQTGGGPARIKTVRKKTTPNPFSCTFLEE
jgi:hypothetical protein